MNELPTAREIKLRKLKPLAPTFHQHLARSKLLGNSCQVGDKIIVYEVTSTEPSGRVVVTEETLIHFENV
ncbi:hypothetical protein ACFL9T_13000 [Thermodesulfobacteriota bacterium]